MKTSETALKDPGAIAVLEQSLSRLKAFVEDAKYKGYDPYDGLMSPIFRLPFLRSNKKIRFYSQQLIKRFPINLRPILGIRKGLNPVSLGLCIQGYTALYRENPEKYQSVLNDLFENLISLESKGFHGACWGYDFDWEARYARIPAFQPTAVATGIITNALFRFQKYSGNEKVKQLVINSAGFILEDLNRKYDEKGDICFSYSPFDYQTVFNASLKGARLLAQVSSLTADLEMGQTAIRAARYVAKHQHHNGAWAYAENKGKWTDNYHTGYVLDCLHEISALLKTNEFDSAIHKGFEYYKSHFFESDGMPKFYDSASYPVDCTAAAQSILTLVRFGELDMASNVAGYMIEHMQSPKGNFYFRKYQNHTERVAFMRWSDAWMFAALSELLMAMKTNQKEIR